jgi:hypothetical protein
MKSERELHKQLYECNAAIERLDLNSTPRFPTDTRGYWSRKRNRTRAYLRGYQRRREARRAPDHSHSQKPTRSNTYRNINTPTERSTHKSNRTRELILCDVLIKPDNDVQ